MNFASSTTAAEVQSKSEAACRRAVTFPTTTLSTQRQRRVIFPSLHSNPYEQQGLMNGNQKEDREETARSSSSVTDTHHHPPQLGTTASSSTFALPCSPDLSSSEAGSRLCDELGLDVPSRSLCDATRPPPKTSPVKNTSTTTVTDAPPVQLTTRDNEDQKLLDALSSSFVLRSPGLSPSNSHRLCDELNLEAAPFRLDDGSTASNEKSRSIPTSKVTKNSQHFVPNNPSPPVLANTRPPSTDSKSPSRRSRVDRSSSRLTKSSSSSPTTTSTTRLSFSCPTSPQTTTATTRPSSILRHRSTRRTSSLPLPNDHHHASSTMTTTTDDDKTVLPSLVPCGGEGSSTSTSSSNETLHSLQSQTSSSDHSSSEQYVPRGPALTRSVSFDARVWVHEYERGPDEMTDRAWFSPEELEHFRKQTVARLVAHNTELLPSGTGFVVQRGNIPSSSSKAVFAMPVMSALAEDDDDDDDDLEEVDESEVEDAVNAEIQNILVVDPHDVCAKLFRRDLKRMIPSVDVWTAFSTEEARKQLEEIERIDVVIVEERLRQFHRHTVKNSSACLLSGSAFVKAMIEERAGVVPTEETCLFIATSAHLDKDKHKMQSSGADFVWAKPPPKMDEIVRDVLLKAILVKRKKQALADRLFGSVMGAP